MVANNMSQVGRAWRGPAYGLVLVLVSATAVRAAGENQAFTVANYPVEAEAKNAVAAKRQAISDGQRSAFRSLLKRIVPVTAYGRLKRLDGVKAAGYISGMSVRSERNSSTRYIASLDFTFGADNVRSLLQNNGIPFIDDIAPKTTVVPVYRTGPGAKPELRLGEWGDIWKGLDLKHTVTPVQIAALKASVHGDALGALEKGDMSSHRILRSEYRSERVVVAIAERNDAAKRLHVSLAGRDSVGTFSLKRNYIVDDGDLGYAMEYAAVVSLGIIEGRWKAVKARASGGLDVLSGPSEAINIQVQFDAPGQWYQIQNQLGEIQGVNDLRVGSVSARSAEVSLQFPGGAPQLAVLLAQRGLLLTNAGADWVLRRGGY